MQPEWDQKNHIMQSPILGLILSTCDNLMREEPTQQASDPKKLTSLRPSHSLPFPPSAGIYYARSWDTGWARPGNCPREARGLIWQLSQKPIVFSAVSL